MKHPSTLLWIAATAGFAMGCGSGEQPKLCLLGPEQVSGVPPLTMDCAAANTLSGLREGSTFFIRHELPSGIEPPGPVHVRIATACDSQELDATYGFDDQNDRSAVLIPRLAPLGSVCGVVVTASIANSSLQTSTPLIPGECRPTDCPTGDDTIGDGGSE